MPRAKPQIEIVPVTPARWDDLCALFGERGAYSGCWCMWWRVRSPEFNGLTREGREHALHAEVEREEVPGLLAYVDRVPAGWVSVAPNPRFARLQFSRTLRSDPDPAIWSIVCFYVDKAHRRNGLMTKLVRAAVEYARARGAHAIQGFPVEPGDKTMPPVEGFTGMAGVFRRAGFRPLAENSRLYRRTLRASRAAKQSVNQQK